MFSGIDLTELTERPEPDATLDILSRLGICPNFYSFPLLLIWMSIYDWGGLPEC